MNDELRAVPALAMLLADWVEQIDRSGFAILPCVFPGALIDKVAAELGEALRGVGDEAEAIRSRAGTVYAARNVLALYPAARDLWRRPPLIDLLSAVLGTGFGLVRALYFDKPPERTWSLPWHKDLTIAVRDNSRPTRHFCKPTTKAGVPHVEASEEILAAMLTVRIHLDDVTDENGPLKVIPGSHRSGKQATAEGGSTESILVSSGDVLAIRPLVAHASGSSDPDTTRHRRILHLEFAGQETLPDGYQWHEFHR